VLFLFTALPEDYVQAFCTSAVHRSAVPCDSTAFLFSLLNSAFNLTELSVWMIITLDEKVFAHVQRPAILESFIHPTK